MPRLRAALPRRLDLQNRTSSWANGRLARAALPLLAALPVVLQALDSRAQATPPGPMTWTFGYDAEGNPKTITNPNGGVTEHTYDSLNRRRTTTLPQPAPGVPRSVVRMDYDGRDQMARVQDPRNLATVYERDGLGRVLSIRSPDSGLTTFTHDAGDEPITRTDARGITHTYSYDDLNRLERVDYPTGTPTVYEYDGGGNGVVGLIGWLTGITDESGSTRYDYTGFGDVKSKTQVVNSAAGSRTFTITTEWGERGIVTGKPVRITYPSGASVEIGYEYAGRPGSITVTRNGQASILLSGVTYNALHALKGWTWGDGTTYRRTFDSFLRLSSYPLGNPQGTGAAMGLTRTLSRDNAGNVTGYIHTGQPGFDQTHRYDGLDRLVETQKTNARYGYQYDATGNRRVREIGSESYLHTVEDGSNRLVTVQEPSGNGGTVTRTYQYGPIGNLVNDGINTFVYSDRGRMSRADTPNGSVSYLVNGKGERVSKTGLIVPTGAAYYVYDEDSRLLGEYDANGAPLYEVIYLRGTPVGVMTPTGLYYVYADHIDTPRVIARNTDHAIVWRWDEAEAFGATPPNEDPNGFGSFTFNMRFPGQVYDRETGLFYNGNRDYRPPEGRYVQFDPIGLEGGINGYTYVGGNPLSGIDLRGLDCTGTSTSVTCIVPGGPQITFPRPANWPDQIKPGDSNYHYYNKWVSASGADKKCVEDYIRNHPTPGSPRPATPSGTTNNASPDWVPSLFPSPVMSYSTSYNGSPVVVNVTLPGHPLFPGYVARTVNGNIVNNFGEGTGVLQNPNMPGSDRFINNVWYDLTAKAIEACSCK